MSRYREVGIKASRKEKAEGNRALYVIWIMPHYGIEWNFDMSNTTAIYYDSITGEEDPRVVQVLGDSTIGISRSLDVQLEPRRGHAGHGSRLEVPSHGNWLKHIQYPDGTEDDVSPNYLYFLPSLSGRNDQSERGRSYLSRFLSDYMTELIQRWWVSKSSQSNKDKIYFDINISLPDVKILRISFDRCDRKWKLFALVDPAFGSIVCAHSVNLYGADGVISVFIKQLAEMNYYDAKQN